MNNTLLRLESDIHFFLPTDRNHTNTFLLMLKIVKKLTALLSKASCYFI